MDFSKKIPLENITAEESGKKIIFYKLEDILESISDAFFSLDEDMVVTYFNNAAERILNRKRDDVIGHYLFDVFPEARGSIFEEKYRYAIEKKLFIAFETYFNVPPFVNWYDVRVYPMEKGISVFFQSITERKKTEEELKSAYSKLNALWNISSIANKDIKTISDYVLSSITEMTGSEYGFYGFINEDETVMTIHSWSGEAMKNCSMVNKPCDFPIETSGIWAEAVRKREPFILNDYNICHSAKKGIPEGHVSLSNLLVVPFFYNGNIKSLAAVANRQLPYSQDDIFQITSFLTGIQAIVEQMQVKEALAESEEKYRLLVETSQDLIWQCDEEGRYIYLNPAWEKTFGYKIEEMLGRRFTDFQTPEMGKKDMEEFSRLMKEGIVKGYETIHIGKNGEPVYLVFNAISVYDSRRNFFGTRGTATDITERKKTEKLIKYTENKYRNFVINANEGIYRIDFSELIPVNLPDETLIEIISRCAIVGEVNHALAKMYGLEPKDMIGHLATEFAPEYGKRALLAIRAPGHQVMDTETIDIDKDGKHLYLLENFTAIIEDELLMHIWGTQRNITERKLAEEEKKKLQERLNHAQKMESIGRLAGGVAHDFNNMLSIILGSAEMALEDIEPSHNLYDELKSIQKAAMRSAELTRQLLAFARKQTIAPKILDLNDTVSGMLRMLQRLIGEDISLLWIPGANIWPVKMDPLQIDQILANLCVNSRDAISCNGKIIIETKNISFYEPSDAGQNIIPGNYVMLSVSDNGCGMEQETVEHIFEPFFSTKEIGKGTGLGLATVYGIVSQNNGFIHVFSTPGIGSSFRIYIPKFLEKIEHGEYSPELSLQKIYSGTILLVEDEINLLNMVEAMLVKLGYKVFTANTPGRALHFARKYRETIDLLISDIVMPEMNGRDLAEKIMSIHTNLKCLFMSGYTADVIANYCIIEDGIQFIQKPFSKKELGEKIRQVLDI